MDKFKAYYIVHGDAVVDGPFMTVVAAYDGLKRFDAPFRGLCQIMRTTVVGEVL